MIVGSILSMESIAMEGSWNSAGGEDGAFIYSDTETRRNGYLDSRNHFIKRTRTNSIDSSAGSPVGIQLPTPDNEEDEDIDCSDGVVGGGGGGNSTVGEEELSENLLPDVQDILLAEARAIQIMSQQLDKKQVNSFVSALAECSGAIIVSGMGKSGTIGMKISATFASIGFPSFFLHPSEAGHGDYGRIRKGDLMLLLSNSGETTEILQMCNHLYKSDFGATILAITSTISSTLACMADLVISTGKIKEASQLSAPTSSTTALLALGDALALAMIKHKKILPSDAHSAFRRNHPGGAIGRQL